MWSLQFPPPPWTCEAVLPEAVHLLEEMPTRPKRLVAILEGDFRLSYSYDQRVACIHDLMRTYADQSRSFADACLVRMAELRPDCPVVKIDEDVRVYRTVGEERLDMRLPEER